MKSRVDRVSFFFSLLFGILLVYVLLIQIVWRDNYRTKPQNPRKGEDYACRGRIYDRRGELLCSSQSVKGEMKRVYPRKELFSPLLGYSHKRLGADGLEKYQDEILRGTRLPRTLSEAITFINGKSLHGRDIYLTLDSRIQEAATEAIKGYRGSIVVIDPRTGEILALVSAPSYDPNRIDREWERLKKDPGTPLLNRAIEGRYPPGSTFKVFTLAVALQLGYVSPGDTFDCTGSYRIGSYSFHEALGEVHGRVNAEDALVHSCNIAFAQMGLKTGADNFCEYARSYGLTEDFSIGIPVAGLPFPDASTLTEGGLAQSAFGQGEVTVSPLQLSLVMNAVAHEGSIMKPFVIKATSSGQGSPLYPNHPQIWKQPLSKESARQVASMMVQVVERGTGYGARIPGVSMAGKTGTAENPHGADHAWFTAFAPSDNPRYLIVTILENAGFGGRVAAPLTGRLMKKCLDLRQD